jgi:hypothetical protein
MAAVIPMFRKAGALLCLTLALGTLSKLRSWAADESLEYQVKAAFLLNFTKFIEWPPAAFELPNSPVTICILGEDPFGGSLNQIVAGESVNGRNIAVLRIDRPPAQKVCQVLFWGKSNAPSKAVPELGPGVLTVGEGERFVREGGMIGFLIDNRRVRFDINQSKAEGAGLKLSSKLLSVARTVEK